ncbi:MAG: DUF2802 domain-containing protein [Deltaproteobacteria bacterium]|nr:DUF2802 domain-containing protein [Deltaproteobacteria bacterium]
MDLKSLILFQVMADAGLCIAVVLLLWQIGKVRKKLRPVMEHEAFLEFRQLVDESQNAAAQLAQALDEGHKSLHEMARRFDEKEKRLTALIEQAEKGISGTGTVPAGEALNPISADDRYRNVKEMILMGLSEEEIVAQCGLPEGEARLLIDIHHKRTRT